MDEIQPQNIIYSPECGKKDPDFTDVCKHCGLNIKKFFNIKIELIINPKSITDLNRIIKWI